MLSFFLDYILQLSFIVVVVVIAAVVTATATVMCDKQLCSHCVVCEKQYFYTPPSLWFQLWSGRPDAVCLHSYLSLISAMIWTAWRSMFTLPPLSDFSYDLDGLTQYVYTPPSLWFQLWSGRPDAVCLHSPLSLISAMIWTAWRSMFTLPPLSDFSYDLEGLTQYVYTPPSLWFQLWSGRPDAVCLHSPLSLRFQLWSGRPDAVSLHSPLSLISAMIWTAWRSMFTLPPLSDFSYDLDGLTQYVYTPPSLWFQPWSGRPDAVCLHSPLSLISAMIWTAWRSMFTLPPLSDFSYDLDGLTQYVSTPPSLWF